MTIWIVRRPWFIALFVAFSIWRLIEDGATVWGVVMLVYNVVLLALSIANIMTRGRVERSLIYNVP